MFRVSGNVPRDNLRIQQLFESRLVFGAWIWYKAVDVQTLLHFALRTFFTPLSAVRVFQPANVSDRLVRVHVSTFASLLVLSILSLRVHSQPVILQQPKDQLSIPIENSATFQVEAHRKEKMLQRLGKK